MQPMTAQLYDPPSASPPLVSPGGRWARWIAAGVGALAIASVVLQVMAFPAALGEEDVVDSLVLSVSFTLVGGVIASRLPGHRFGWVVLAIGALGAMAAASASAPGPWAVHWVGYWVWWLPLGLLPVALLLFPTGRLPSRRWRWVLGLAGVGLLAPALGLAIARYLHPDPLGLSGSVDPEAGQPWVLLSQVGAVVAAAALVAALLSLVVRVRIASEFERRQILCLAVGAVALLLGLVLAALAVPWAWLVGAVAIPIAAGVAILWHRLFDLDLVINRSLVYLGLSTGLLLAYASMVWLGNLLVEGTLPVTPLVAAVVIAVGLHPLRTRLQGSVDRLFYGNQSDPYAVVTALSRRFEARTNPAAVLATAAETVAQSLALPFVALDVNVDGHLERAAEWGRRSEALVAVKLNHQGEPVGRLLVAPRTLGGGLSHDERRLLEDLASQIALTVHAVQLSARLQRSREALVNTREEERRRLRRDLHDGLGPTLAGMTMQLDAARNLLDGDSATVDRLLTGLQEQAQGAVTEIRRVAYELRPPALDELGLIGAIEESAERFGVGRARSQGLDVTFEGPDTLPPLPAAVEVAALRIVQEALANVARHSGAQRCTIRLAVNGAVELDLEDDGHGFPPDQRLGVGLRSMRERAAELGGTCEVSSLGGHGTRVHARLPVSET